MSIDHGRRLSRLARRISHSHCLFFLGGTFLPLVLEAVELRSRVDFEAVYEGDFGL